MKTFIHRTYNGSKPKGKDAVLYRAFDACLFLPPASYSKEPVSTKAL